MLHCISTWALTRFLAPPHGDAVKVLVLHTPKGGAGKSTLAREVAVGLSLAGRRVALADLDPQGTISGWYQRRSSGVPALVELGGEDQLGRIAEAGAEVLVVDTPPGAGGGGLMLARADAVLVPVRPTPDDLLAAAPIAEALADRKWAFVPCQVPARSRLADQAVRKLAALGRVAPVSIGFRADYPTAAITGQAAVEFPDTKAAAEVKELLAYINASMLRG